jgi:hypothetical protein
LLPLKRIDVTVINFMNFYSKEPKVTAEPVVTSSSSKIIVRYVVESAVEPSAVWMIGGKTVKSGGRYAINIVKVSKGYEVSIEVDKVSVQEPSYLPVIMLMVPWSCSRPHKTAGHTSVRSPTKPAILSKLLQSKVG